MRRTHAQDHLLATATSDSARVADRPMKSPERSATAAWATVQGTTNHIASVDSVGSTGARFSTLASATRSRRGSVLSEVGRPVVDTGGSSAPDRGRLFGDIQEAVPLDAIVE